MAKEAISDAAELGLREGLGRERSLFHAAFGLEEQKEGMKTFWGKTEIKVTELLRRDLGRRCACEDRRHFANGPPFDTSTFDTFWMHDASKSMEQKHGAKAKEWYKQK